MKKIYVATKARGFLKNLFKANFGNFMFVFEDKKIYEMSSSGRKLLSKAVKSKIADYLGIIQRIKVEEKSCDLLFSYNRFLKSNKDYVIYLENPLALIHYSTARNKTKLGLRRLNRYFHDKNLKAIICLSKACYDTINNFYNIPEHIKIDHIYPYVEKNFNIDKESITKKCYKESLECLYISSNFNLKGGKDILVTFEKLQKLNINNIKLKIITSLNSLDDDSTAKICANKNIEVFDFKFDSSELAQIYNESCIYLNPTRQDSFSLVVLEAMKSGNAVLTTDLYALTEMVENDYNGYLTNPKYRFFNHDNMPNEDVWNNRNDTIYSDYVDENIVNFLFDNIVMLNANREKLAELSQNSYIKATTGEFDEKFIVNKWKTILSEIAHD